MTELTGEGPRRRVWIGALAAITVVGFLLRSCGLSDQPPLRDEALSAITAQHFVEQGRFGPTMPFHPNLRNWILFGTTSGLGTGAWGLRGASVLLGTLSLPLLAWIVVLATGRRRAALVAAFLLCFDTVHVTFSRQSIQEVHTAFFVLLGVLGTLLALDAQRPEKRLWALPLSGLAFGLAIASKHQGVPPWLVCLGFLAIVFIRRRDLHATLLASVSLVAIPSAVYLWTYLPWFRRGYSLGEWLRAQADLLSEIVTHTGYVDSSALFDRPWQWFVRPLVGYGNFALVDGTPHVTLALANPLVWLLVLPSSLYLWARRRADPGIQILLFLFWFSWLPLALSPRPIWLLSSVVVIPFAFAQVGLFLSDRMSSRRWLAIFVGLVVASGLLLYPLAQGEGWTAEYLRPLVVHYLPHG